MKTFRPTKIAIKRPLLYLMLAAQASTFYHGVYNAVDIFSPKIKTLVSSKLGCFISNRKVRSVPRMPVAAYGVKRVNGKAVTKSCAAVIYPQAHNNYPQSR